MEQEHHKQKSYELIHVQFLEAAQHSHSCAMPQLCNATVVQCHSCAMPQLCNTKAARKDSIQVLHVQLILQE